MWFVPMSRYWSGPDANDSGDGGNSSGPTVQRRFPNHPHCC